MSTVRKAVLIGIGGAGLWAGVITLSTNYQKANSPLVRDVLFTLRNTPQVKQSLGDDLEPGFWFSGSINQFKVRGHGLSPAASSCAAPVGSLRVRR